MYFCLRIDLDYVPWDTPDATEFGHGEPAVFLPHDAAGEHEVRSGDRDHGLELRAQARLLARRTAGEIVDFQENNTGQDRACHRRRMQGLPAFE